MRSKSKWQLTLVGLLVVGVSAACYLFSGNARPAVLVVPQALAEDMHVADTALREQLFERTHMMLVMQETASGLEPVAHYRYGHSISAENVINVDLDHPLHISDYLLFGDIDADLFLLVRRRSDEPWRRLALTPELLTNARRSCRLLLPELTSLPVHR